MLTFFIAGLLALAAPEMIPEEDVELTGRSAPDFALKTLDGADFRLSDYRGKVVVLSFWASWCGPCRFELPELSRIQPSYPDVSFVAVNVDRERKDAERFLKRVKFDLPIVWDNEAMVLGDFSVVSMPTMFLIDKNGTVQFVKVGYSRQKKLVELEEKIKGLQQ